MKKRILVLMLILVLLVSACGSAATPSLSRQSESFGPAATAPAAPSSASGQKGVSNAAGGTTPSDSTSNAGVQRLVIKNASLTIVVKEPATTLDFVAKMAEEMGGYVVTSKLYKTTTRSGSEVPEAAITVRVPAEKLNDALTKIKAQVKDPAKDVRSENVSGTDVTKDYTDLQSRLTNLEQAQQQLEKIMDSATKTDDVLNVYNRLVEINEQIEVIKGQMKYYEESAALSAIELQIVAEASVQPLEIGGWQPVGVARDAIQALIDVAKFLGYALIWLVLFCLPISIVIFIPIRFAYIPFRRWWLKRKAAKKAATMPPSPPAAPAA